MRLTALLVIALIGMFAWFSATYTVDEGEQAIITQFGEPVGDVINTPGLHFKLPMVQQVRRFDKRVLRWDGDVSQIPTLGREFVVVDTTARWRIADPLRFLRSVRDELGARTRLDDILDSVTRDIVSGTELEEIVRSRDWNVKASDLLAEGVPTDAVDLDRPKMGRELLEKEMFEAAAKQMPELGIELVDVRIKRINYIDSVRAQVEERMISERQSIAARFRAEGEGRSQEILGEMERDLRRIRSEAERRAAEIMGKGDAEATRIFGEAYEQDPEFYAYYQTLQSYGAVGANTTLLLDGDSDYLRYLESTRPAPSR